MHEIQCTIDRINDPRRAIGQFTFCTFARRFFANETEIKMQSTKIILLDKQQSNQLTYRWCENSALNVLISNFSTSWSVSVTRSMSLNFTFTSLVFQNRLAINWNGIETIDGKSMRWKNICKWSYIAGFLNHIRNNFVAFIQILIARTHFRFVQHKTLQLPIKYGLLDSRWIEISKCKIMNATICNVTISSIPC